MRKFHVRKLAALSCIATLFLFQPGVSHGFWWKSLKCDDDGVKARISDQVKSYFNSTSIRLDGSEIAGMLAAYLRDVPSRIDVISVKDLSNNDESRECELLGQLVFDRRDSNAIAFLASEDRAIKPRLDTPEGKATFGVFLRLITGGFSARVSYRIFEGQDGSIEFNIVRIEPNPL